MTQFDLTDEQRQIQEMARQFTANALFARRVLKEEPKQ